MNICFFLGGFTGIGGIGRVVSILANSLCEKPNVNVYTISLFNNGKKNHYEIDEKVVQKYLFENPTNMKRAMLKGGSVKLRKIIKENNIDILIACGALYYPIVVSSVIGLKTKTICWEHSNAMNDKDHSFQEFSRWVGAKYAHCVVTLTKQDQKMYIEKYKNSRVKQIYNPTDENIFRHAKEYDPEFKKIVSVGRFSYPKNFELLVEIARKVLKKHPDWVWEIYGDGESKDNVQTMINNYNLNDKLLLKGSVNNLYELYSRYSFLVMTSRYEGFPMSLLEGLSSGLPLISFDVLTGPREIIFHDVNGFLVEPLNAELMIQSIETLINDKKRRISMSAQSLELSESFRTDIILKIWMSLFNEILGKGDL